MMPCMLLPHRVAPARKWLGISCVCAMPYATSICIPIVIVPSIPRTAASPHGRDGTHALLLPPLSPVPFPPPALTSPTSPSQFLEVLLRDAQPLVIGAAACALLSASSSPSLQRAASSAAASLEAVDASSAGAQVHSVMW